MLDMPLSAQADTIANVSGAVQVDLESPISILGNRRRSTVHIAPETNKGEAPSHLAP